MLAPVIAGPGALALLKLFALLQLIVHCVAGVEDSVCVSSQQPGRWCLSARAGTRIFVGCPSGIRGTGGWCEIQNLSSELLLCLLLLAAACVQVLGSTQV